MTCLGWCWVRFAPGKATDVTQKGCILRMRMLFLVMSTLTMMIIDGIRITIILVPGHCYFHSSNDDDDDSDDSSDSHAHEDDDDAAEDDNSDADDDGDDDLNDK